MSTAEQLKYPNTGNPFLRLLRRENGHQPIVEEETIDYEGLLFEEVMKVAAEHPYINMDDYDMDVVRQQILQPIAEYIQRVESQKKSQNQNGNGKRFWERSPKIAGVVKPESPLIISGDPGIGKTTLLMMIDQALTRIGADRSARKMIGDGQIAGYFGEHKGNKVVTPLMLQENRTAVIRISDWNDLLLHWTYDAEKTHRDDPEALRDFLKSLEGRVVFADDVEKENHTHFVSTLSRHGILVIISSNLGSDSLHLQNNDPRAVHLYGRDHREGNIAEVCVTGESELLNTVRKQDALNDVSREKFKVIQRGTRRVAFAEWRDLQDSSFLSAQFADFFRRQKIDGVVIDGFPFFSGVTAKDINPTMLGHVYRYVQLLDAVHDLHLPFVMRTTDQQGIGSDYQATELESALLQYDERSDEARQQKTGQAAFVEINRCLSRLRSRQSMNGRFFPAFMAAEEFDPRLLPMDMPTDERVRRTPELQDMSALQEKIIHDWLIVNAFRHDDMMYGRSWDME